MKKKLGINMVLNVINSVVTMIFPLITFPYVSKILGVNNVGSVNFANSIISYFILFACLGINAYSIREGAKIRDNRSEIKKFISEMFSLLMISTAISYILLYITMMSYDKLFDYRELLLVLSLQIIGTTIGVDWIFTIYEDFLFATIRNISIKILSCLAIFGLVKDDKDTIIYALILSGVMLVNAILNIIFSRKYCDFRFTFHIHITKHIKPILLLFATSLTVSIFVNSDTTLLGILSGDHAVGIYSVSTKIYLLVKNVLSAIITVSISRLAYLIGKNNMEEFKSTALDIHKTLMTFLFPSIVGIILLHKEIICVISDQAYISAGISLVILAIALVFSLESWYWGQCILVPLGKEKLVFWSTLVSAIVNVVLNLLLIPYFDENAAAFTTLISELICFLWAYIAAKKYVDKETLLFFVIKIIVGCLAIVLVILTVKNILNGMILICMISIVISGLVYFIVELLLKNEIIIAILHNLKNKIHND